MIRDDIKAATIAAMKGGDKETHGTLRLVQAAIKNRDIEARTGGAPADDDALVTEVLQKMIKQRRELAELYRKGNREDRAAAEEAEIAVIERFLPAQMSDEEAEAQDPRDHRRNRRLLDEGHGPGHGAGEGAPRHQHRAGARASGLVKAALNDSPAAGGGAARLGRRQQAQRAAELRLRSHLFR